jgi:hypothetical protein
MGTSSTHIAAPIFVVGSPRSGTSILTWCLGQHPNILPTEESDWLGVFAAQAAAQHALGSVRGERSQLSALGLERAEFLRGLGDAIDAMLLGHRERLEQLNWTAAQNDPRQVSVEFAVSRDATEPKSRWVDGTPEYSLSICGLHGLFPAAKFVHILRDADEVAASMLAFRHADGTPLVRSADEAYAYWERTTRACVLAEQVLGPDVVYRLRHADLIERPEAALQEVFTFLGESFAAVSLEPLRRRINSSFTDAPPAAQCTEESAAINAARQLSTELQQERTPDAPSAAAREQFEAEFERRVSYFLRVDGNLTIARNRIAELYAQERQRDDQVKLRDARFATMLNACGALLGMQFAVALILAVVRHATLVSWPPAPELIYLVFATSGVIGYAWLRRAGLSAWWSRRFAAAEKSTEVVQ